MGNVSSNEADYSSPETDDETESESDVSSPEFSDVTSESSYHSPLSTHSEADSIQTLSGAEIEVDHPAPIDIPLSPKVQMLTNISYPSPSLATAGSTSPPSPSEIEEKLIAAIKPQQAPLISVMELPNWENGMEIPAGCYHPDPNYTPDPDFVDILNLSANDGFEELFDLPVAQFFGNQESSASSDDDSEVANSHQLDLYNLPPLDPNHTIIDSGEPLPEGIQLPPLWRNLLFSPNDNQVRIPGQDKITRVWQKHENPDLFKTPTREVKEDSDNPYYPFTCLSPSSNPHCYTLSPYLCPGSQHGATNSQDDLNRPSTSGYVPPKRLHYSSSSSARSPGNLSSVSSTSTSSNSPKRKNGGYHYFTDLDHPYAGPVKVFKRHNHVHRYRPSYLRPNQNCQNSQTVREFDRHLNLKQASNSYPRNLHVCQICHQIGHYEAECSPSHPTTSNQNTAERSTQTPPLKETKERSTSEEVSPLKKKLKL